MKLRSYFILIQTIEYHNKPDRAKNRSKTYEGIAKAMAEQWG